MDVFVPDALNQPEALLRTTHLGVGAHPDDLEFMALSAILSCAESADDWFGGIVCTSGSGSVQSGQSEPLDRKTLASRRHAEQIAAARLGHYSFLAQLGFSSESLLSPFSREECAIELAKLLAAVRPRKLFSHHPFDKHPTHVAAFASLLSALRKLPSDQQPEQWLGCEVWRGLDWLPDRLKVSLPVPASGSLKGLGRQLCEVFQSQIQGGKRYDLAVEGRRQANATFFDSHSPDPSAEVIFAVDLAAFLRDASLDTESFVSNHLQDFHDEVLDLVRDLSA